MKKRRTNACQDSFRLLAKVLLAGQKGLSVGDEKNSILSAGTEVQDSPHSTIPRLKIIHAQYGAFHPPSGPVTPLRAKDLRGSGLVLGTEQHIAKSFVIIFPLFCGCGPIWELYNNSWEV